MAYITENRREEGLLMPKSVKENLVLASLRSNGEKPRARWTPSARTRTAIFAIERLSIKTYDKSRQLRGCSRAATSRRWSSGSGC